MQEISGTNVVTNVVINEEKIIALLRQDGSMSANMLAVSVGITGRQAQHKTPHQPGETKMYETKINNFNLKQIAKSGQCFRIHEEAPAEFSIVAKNRLLIAEDLGDSRYLFHCSREEFENVWEDYFDLHTPYDSIQKEAVNHKDSFVQTAAEYGSGIRILRQDLWETIISYLIARCKNIAGISKCIETICRTYGSVLGEYKGKEYYSFPGWEEILQGDLQQLLDCGLGFRAKDIYQISRLAAEGQFDLEYLKNASYAEGFDYLTSFRYEKADGKRKKVKNFPGIGPKVANCILLYGLHQIESVPEDVWIIRIRDEEYKGKRPWWYDFPYAGIVQQWVFYYRRTAGHGL